MVGVLMRIAAWLVANWRAVSLGAGVSSVFELMRRGGIDQIIYEWIVSEAAERAGLNLSPDDPLSDASLSRALSERSGITIRSLVDKEGIKVDLMEGAAKVVRDRTGIPVRTFADKAMILEDLEAYALDQLEQRTAIRLSSLRDVEALRGDFLRIAGGVITGQTGIPLTDITSPDQIKLDLLDWAKDQAMLEMGESVSAAVTAEWKKGVSMLTMVREKLGKNVSPRALLRGVNNAMVGRYMVRLEAAGAGVVTKAERRKLQNKMAQRRFRARGERGGPMWDGRKGGKNAYVPKGWDVVVTPPAVPVKKRLGGGRNIGLKR